MSDDLTPAFKASHGPLPAEQVALPPAPPTLDYAKYVDDIKEFGLSDEQEREFLEILWSIMRSFVELGFGTDICVQMLQNFNLAAEPPPSDISSE